MLALKQNAEDQGAEMAPADPAEIERLHAKIGQFLVERDFLKDAAVKHLLAS